MEQIQLRPELPWRSNSMWTFKNEAKIYGSPMFDTVWAKLNGSEEDSMTELIDRLNKAK